MSVPSRFQGVQFVYTPEGAEPKRWDFDPERLMSPELEVIERKTGMYFATWLDAIFNGMSVIAMHGLLFVYLKREEPTLKWEQVVFSMGEVDWHLPDTATPGGDDADDDDATDDEDAEAPKG